MFNVFMYFSMVEPYAILLHWDTVEGLMLDTILLKTKSDKHS